MSISTYTTGLINALNITFDKSNNLYIANGTANNIIKVDILGNQTIFVSGFNYVENIVFDNTGEYLYVMDSLNTIYKVDVNGNKTIFITNLTHHYLGMCFDNNNNLYYTNVFNYIFKIDSSGITTTFINGTGILNYPIGVAFDSTGNLYICGYNQYISKYDSIGTLINAQFMTTPDSSFNWYNLIFDKDNNIYATYGNVNYGQQLNKYDSNGNLLLSIYTDLTNSILGLNFDSNKHLYFTSNNNNDIMKYGNVSPIPCFKEGSKILTDKGYIPIQDLRKGDLVKTIKNEYVPINMIGQKKMEHNALEERIKDQLYKCSPKQYPELIEDLIITGSHSILVDDFINNNQRNQTEKVLGKIYVTDNKYRLPASVDERSSVYENKGTYTIYHIALDNENYYGNYGIWANGLLVETCSKRYLKELSNMILIE